MTAPAVSIVIPTLNAGPLFDQVLDALHRQVCESRSDIIAVDSGSTDGTLERLQSARAQVLHVPGERFNHGEARNAGLSRATGELAVLLVQDAVPATSGWLQALIAPFRTDDAVAGSFARQLPRRDASRLTAHYLSKWVATQEVPRVVGPLTPEAFTRMTPSERHVTCAFDNVCACVRLAAWRSHPFSRTPIAEDLEWGRDVLLAGHKLAYTPGAAVWHSHERPVKYELRRTYLVHQRLQALFELSTVPTFSSLLRAMGATLPVHVRLALGEDRRRLRHVARGAALAVAWPLGQFLGARSARDGRESLRRRRI